MAREWERAGADTGYFSERKEAISPSAKKRSKACDWEGRPTLHQAQANM